MVELDTRTMIQAAASGAAASAATPGRVERRRLPKAALAVAAEHAPPAYSQVVLAGVVRLIEFVLIAFIGASIYAAYVLPIDSFTWYYAAAVLAISGFSVLGFQSAGLYQMQAISGQASVYLRLASTWSLVFFVVIGISFFAKIGELVSRVWLATFFLCGAAALVGFRLALGQLVRQWMRDGRLERRTVVVGADAEGETLIQALAKAKDSGVRILGVFDDRGEDRAGESCGGKPRLGTVNDLVEFARRTRVDLVIFSLPITAEKRILQMLKKLWVLPVDIRLSAHTNKLRFRPRSYSYIGDVPVLDVFDRPITDWDVVVKSLFDRVVGGLLLIAALPVMALVALAIKLDSRGPVLFKQQRYGFNNERIEVYKFRSMYTEQCDPKATKIVTRNDPRVTRVGRFIRKTSLDELPQLFNVAIKGNLSLVGPRPHAVYQKLEDRSLDEAVDGYFARHRVKPGITGWAQIHGYRGEVDNQDKIQRRVEYDLYYIENWSVLLDLYILFSTPFALLKTENAY